MLRYLHYSNTSKFSSEFSLENEVFCHFFMQEKWPPIMRKFRIFIVAISNLVYVPLFRLGEPVFKVHVVIRWCNKSWENSVVFVAAISSLCVCNVTRQESCENSAFSLQLFLAYMCMYVLRHMTQQSYMKILCFHCSYFQLMCVFVCSAFCLDRARLALRCSSIWTEFASCHTFCNFNFWILLRNK